MVVARVKLQRLRCASAQWADAHRVLGVHRGCEVMQCRSSSSSDGGVVLHTRAIQRDRPPWLGSFIPRASSCCCVSALFCAMAWLAAKSLWSDTKRAEQSGASNPYKNANAPIKLGVSDRALFVRHHRMRCGG